VRAEALNEEVRVTVSDTGPGIPPEQLANVFDRYWQARRSDQEGSGLGLFIAKGIIEAHGGRIWAEAHAGTGATFTFILPGAP
jgi:signal transduction histidine kinase